jgi:electron transfer flavoprotein alpha subunit
MSTLLWIEHDGEFFHPATLNLVQAAKQLPRPCVALLAGNQLSDIASKLALLDGIDEILVVEADYYPFRAEPIAKLLLRESQSFSHILAVATTTSKNIFPRMSALLDNPMLTDVMRIDSETTFVHPIYAGNVLLRETVNDLKSIMTIRASSFEKTNFRENPCPILKKNADGDDERTQVVSCAKRDAETPDLQTAKVIVSGGRGFGDKEQFKLAEKLAREMGAALGATRAAVDAGFISNEHQVGQTGKIVAPELYIAIGISGAIQHLAGMKESKVIVAINKDPEAPIFEIATYGLVADLFVVIPQMMTELSKLKN